MQTPVADVSQLCEPDWRWKSPLKTFIAMIENIKSDPPELLLLRLAQ